jgi:phosphinothricin tripeptide acetyl hydrolase
LLELFELRRDMKGGTIAERRAEYERAAQAFAEPGDTVERVQAGPCPAEWLGGGSLGGPILIYLHGGSYVFGSAASHRHLARALARAAEASALVPDYRLAPEHPFPAALDDAVGAYEWLLASGADPRLVVLAGDSAGGGLAVATLLRLRDAARPLPAAVLCLSPWADLTFAGSSHRTHADRDPVLDGEDLRGMAALYLAGADPADPLASPALGDLGGLPPLSIDVASEEILLSDAHALAAAAEAAGTAVTLCEREGMFHVWQWYYPMLPEAESAIREAGAFLRDAVAAVRP